MDNCRILYLIQCLLLFQTNRNMILFNSLKSLSGTSTGSDWNRYRSHGRTFIFIVSILLDMSRGSIVHLAKSALICLNNQVVIHFVYFGDVLSGIQTPRYLIADVSHLKIKPAFHVSIWYGVIRVYLGLTCIQFIP